MWTMTATQRLAYLFAIAVFVLAVACGPAVPATPTAPPSLSPVPALGQAELKYVLLSRFGPISWCDPDFYPIAHEDEQTLAERRLPEIRADAETYTTITGHLAIAPGPDLSDAQKLAVYRDWKLLNAVVLNPTADGKYGFDLITETNVGLGQGKRHAGTIDSAGAIEFAIEEDTFLVSCPICLARGTLIDTPNGSVPVEQLRPGDRVWTVDESGRRVAMPLAMVGSTPVPASHRVVHAVLDDGRELWVSAGHRLPDGRTVGDLRSGDDLDGGRVLSAELVAYSGGATFDVLPAGSAGWYWANGIMLASTLH